MTSDPANVRALGGLEVGQAAPFLEFAAPDGGEPVQLGRSVMVFTSEGCSPCESLVATWSSTPLIRASGVGCCMGCHGSVGDSSSTRSGGGCATSATALKSRFQAQGTPYGVVIEAMAESPQSGSRTRPSTSAAW